MAGIYIHIPFCKQACYYCDFHFSTNLSLRQPMVDALIAEIILQKKYLESVQIESIYFGGGTPSLLSPKELELILEAIHKNFSIGTDSEVTLEANPDDLAEQKLMELRAAGINRLSIGIQSLDDSVLKSLNRAHDSATAIKCLDAISQAGFQNVSIDLIYAIPRQGHDEWGQAITTILKYRPKHISAYALTIEENTVFGKWAKQGKLASPDDDFTIRQMEILIELLEADGYQQYEVSNFSQPGFESRHNSSYWRGAKYLGIGPSAHSFNGTSRQFNVSNNHQYLAAIQRDEVPALRENLSREDKINEYLLTRLRTRWGVQIATLSADFGFDLLADNAPYLQALQAKEFVRIENGILQLTRAGMLHADKIAADLFIIPD